MIKNIISLFILLLFYVTGVNAQTKSELLTIRDSIAKNIDKFLTIKGVELKPGMRMDDALRIFLDKGWEKHELFNGFKEETNKYLLTGSFFNTEDCLICISPTVNDKNIVSSILISFPKKDSFKDLKKEYDELKYSLSQKYHLMSCTESFDNKLIENSNDDQMKLLALSKDEAKFHTRFNASDTPMASILGYVGINIGHSILSGDKKYNVSICYVTSDSWIEQMTKDDDL